MNGIGNGIALVADRVGSHFLKCHGSHGIPDVQTALQHISCNSYFCKIYNDFITVFLHIIRLKLGIKNGGIICITQDMENRIDLYGEKKGNLPSVEYYNKIFGKGKWRAATIILT